MINYILWTLTTLISLQLAAASCKFISKNAIGSGFAEIRNILKGIPLYKYLSFNSLIAKVIGLIFAASSCASIGIVGPYVHISCLLCNQFLKLNFFKVLSSNIISRNSFLSAAAAVGITLSLGTPLGGIVFAIESTSTASNEKYLWKTVFSAALAFIYVKILPFKKVNDLLNYSIKDEISYKFYLFDYFLISFICGLVGAFLSQTIVKFKNWINSKENNESKNPFKLILFFSVILSTISFFITPLIYSDRLSMLFYFFNKPGSFSQINFDRLSDRSDLLYLALVVVGKFVMIIISVSLPLPSGLISPFIVLGALIGRFYRNLFGESPNFATAEVYSVICGASLLSAVSQSISSAIIIFELVVQHTYLLPLLINTLVALFLSRLLGKSLHELLSRNKSKLKLEQVRRLAKYKASDVITHCLSYCIKASDLTIEKSIEILLKLPKKYNYKVILLDENKRVMHSIQPTTIYRSLVNLFSNQNYSQLIDEINQVLILIKYKYLLKNTFLTIRSNISKFAMTHEEILERNKRKEQRNLQLIDSWEKAVESKCVIRP